MIFALISSFLITAYRLEPVRNHLTIVLASGIGCHAFDSCSGNSHICNRHVSDGLFDESHNSDNYVSISHIVTEMLEIVMLGNIMLVIVMLMIIKLRIVKLMIVKLVIFKK